MALQQVYIVADMAFDAPAQRVWALVGAFADKRLAKGFVSDVTGTGSGVGAKRVLHLLADYGGGQVRERQTARDEKGLYYAYELDDPGALPFDDYYGSAQVVPVTDDSCRVVWLNRYRTAPELVADMRVQSYALLNLIETNLNSELAAEKG